MDTVWALDELAQFLQLTDTRPSRDHYDEQYPVRVGPQDEIVASATVVEQILDRLVYGWRVVDLGVFMQIDRWDRHVEGAKRAQVLLRRHEEIRERLGDAAPQLDASLLHPWIWDGARSLWHSGHYREAVGAAAVKLNAETQNKVGRRDVAETDLFKQIFTLDPPQPGKPRLRIIPDDGSKTFENVHRGARALAEGLYAAIRNPIGHTPGELPEAEALEQLAAFSVLARWVDRAVPDVAPV
jgi:hypothetical protein